MIVLSDVCTNKETKETQIIKKRKRNITAETDIEKLEGTKKEVKEQRERNHLEHLPPSPKAFSIHHFTSASQIMKSYTNHRTNSESFNRKKISGENS